MKIKPFHVVAVIILAIGVVALVFTSTNSNLFQGKFRFSSKSLKCNVILENFDPKGITAKYGDSVDFKWNGPGCSKYEWTQYMLCFKNVKNTAEFACIGIIPPSNHKTLTGANWSFIDSEMITSATSSRVDTYWYVQSIFGDGLRGEILNTEPWKFSYTK